MSVPPLPEPRRADVLLRAPIQSGRTFSPAHFLQPLGKLFKKGMVSDLLTKTSKQKGLCLMG